MIEIIRERPELAVWIVLILAVAVCYIAQVLSGQWRSVRQAELEAILKEQMIQRGMSAQEIVQLMHASLTRGALSEPEFRPLPARHASEADRRWVWLAVGVPVAIFLVCGGLMVAMTSVTVLASENAASIRVDQAEPVPENGR